MNRSKNFMVMLLLIMLNTISLSGRDIILEFKGAYFLPTNHTFRKTYNNGSALYGPELTVQLGCSKYWTKHLYGFISADYFQKKGHALGLNDSTTLRLVPLVLGAKYMIPATDFIDFYVGAGFQSMFVHTRNHRAYVTATKSLWSFGGIGKMGAYFTFKHHFLLDLFFDYSFARTNKDHFYGHTRTCSKADLSSALFGIGVGYRF